METSESSDDELGRLDIDLDRKSKQHNLTSRNVRAILHEVITHERVVAMMKAAIRDTQDLPMFPPQFVDIDLEEDEDSSDEEYCPNEEEEEEDTAEERSAGHLGEQVMSSPCAPQHLLTAPESSFLERLNAVEEELDCSLTYTYNQSLDRKADDGGGDDEGCLAYRTRSKLRLVNVPLGQLEAELLPPDITADMYEQSAARREEDRHWTKWLQGLMAPDNEEEADDDDDPEYNFLDDLDEPDLEDYRTDRAVQITKKEVNELLDELFDTLQEEEQEEDQEEDQDQEQDEEQDEEVLSQTAPKFNVPQALRFEAPLASMLTERRRTVRKQYEALQQRRALQDTTNHQCDNINLKGTPSPQHNTTTPVLVLQNQVFPALHLNYSQKLQLQQQIQQHVQLLTQVHLLLRHVDTLNHEASITKHYLETMKQLTWLAAERRLCADGDSEEDHSPTSQEEEEEEEEGPKGEESGEGRSSRSRPLRGLRRSRQERHSKDSSKLLLLYDENILDNDPHRESKDVAFAQSYLNRVREALQDLPGQVEEFVSLLNEFEQVGDGQEVMLLFRKLRGILGDRTDLLRDFAAFLHPEQALQCGLFEEQQAFERSRRFLRQLEISFGDNPSHYQKIIKALQTGPDLSPTSIHELKTQMASLLKGHTHLQAEFWVFFEELRPPPARPGQFEEAHWPEDGGGVSDGGEGVGQVCDWSDKDWSCLCRDAKIRRHRRKGCSHCHGNKTSGGMSRAMKSLDPLYSQISSTHEEPGDKDLDLKGDDDSPQPVCAKNISLTASGEKVILWTREADRVILTTCQQEGANQNTFQAISTLLGNKTPSEVSHRFRDLMRLFRTAARQTSSEDEALPIEATAANQVED
ncbi:GON-4-like protein [Nibea albiflora]|uniref:GON-4-like protein n=1 Tax=Nibea albiflora TaxID=240163 RepID=A0ACB7EL36_NIBAL|nr:GON-4-like protein [Nibea albiflora]